MRQKLPIVLSVTALFVALLGWTGAGEAAKNALLPEKSVGTPQLKKNAVGPNQLKKRAIKGKHISSDLWRSIRRLVPQGPPGPAGPAGAAGPGWSLSIGTVVRGVISPLDVDSVSAFCPSGWSAVTGGYISDGANIFAEIVDGAEYKVGFDNALTTTSSVSVYPICAPTGTGLLLNTPTTTAKLQAAADKVIE